IPCRNPRNRFAASLCRRPRLTHRFGSGRSVLLSVTAANGSRKGRTPSLNGLAFSRCRALTEAIPQVEAFRSDVNNPAASARLGYYPVGAGRATGFISFALLQLGA